MASPKVAEAKEMDFFDALRLVADGKRITRKEWNEPSTYVAMRDGFLCIVRLGQVDRLLVSDGDLLGTDWFVVRNHHLITH